MIDLNELLAKREELKERLTKYFLDTETTYDKLSKELEMSDYSVREFLLGNHKIKVRLLYKILLFLNKKGY